MPGASDDRYQPGVCNIGPAEIARRRRAGLLGVVVTVAVLVALIVFHAPPMVRFLIALPAAGTAIGMLQAWLKFCVAFGSAGVFNFGALGREQHVVDKQARTRDRFRSIQIIGAGLLIGLAIGLAAALLPI